MRKTTLAIGLLILGFSGSAHADSYRWCAEYGNSSSNGTNCYFTTLQQCRAAISGNGGFCRRNQFYNGRMSNREERRRSY